MKRFFFTITCIIITSSLAFAGEADVLQVKIEKTDDGYVNVCATLQHNDEGWEHYADRWEILDIQGNLLDKRILRHPHSAVPFTRCLPKAKLPKTIKEIRIRAHDTVHGYGGKVVEAHAPE